MQDLENLTTRELAKLLEYFEGYGYNISPNMGLMRIKKYKSKIEEEIKKSSKSDGEKRVELEMLKIAFEKIKALISRKELSEENFIAAKEWLEENKNHLNHKRSQAEDKNPDTQHKKAKRDTKPASYTFERTINGQKHLFRLLRVTDDSPVVVIEDLTFTPKYIDDFVDTYVLIEEIEDKNLIEVDCIYGDINFEAFLQNSNSERLQDIISSRSFIQQNVRRYCGIFPKIEGLQDPERPVIEYDRETVEKVLNLILSDAYKGEFAYKQKQKEKDKFKVDRSTTLSTNIKNFATRKQGNIPGQSTGNGGLLAFATRARTQKDKTDEVNVQALFFKSGMVICNEGVFYRYSYYIQSPDSKGNPTELSSFLLFSDDEEIFEEKGITEKFIKLVGNILLQKGIYNEDYKYIGRMDSQGDLKMDNRAFKFFSKLSSESIEREEKE